MWEIVGVLMCLGAPAPDAGNCFAVNDSWGPYDTLEACQAREEEIKETWPVALALDTGWMGPIAMVGPECTQTGDEI